MSKKIIFLDIDGTLTEPGRSVPPVSAMEAVRAAQRAGHLVFLCTGRSYSMIQDFLAYPFDGYICSAGGYVIYGDQVIYDCPMTPEQQARVLRVLTENHVMKTIECKDGCYFETGFSDFLKNYSDDDGNSEVERWAVIQRAMHMSDMSEYPGSPIYKVVVMCAGKEGLLKSREILKEDFDLIIQDPFGPGIENGEVINRSFNKGKAIERICAYLQHPIEDTVGFGDSMNDKEMLETVGLSVCMANGCQAMKEIADVIAPRVDEDGLYRAFEAYRLM